MAIKILRGYEADRTSITPEDGQLLVSVLPDGSRKLYVGDGITAGGKALTTDAISDFLSLTDTPSTYFGTEGLYAISTGSGVEWSLLTESDITDLDKYTQSEVDSLLTTLSGSIEHYSTATTSGSGLIPALSGRTNEVLSGNGTWTSMPRIWSERGQITLTIDSSKIDDTLTDFPLTVNISEASGTNQENLMALFAAIGPHYQKLSVKTEGGTNCYVEVEVWDYVRFKAVLHVRVPSVSPSADTVLILTYDANMSDNTTYVGLTGSTPAATVWDSNFKAVYHMAQDPIAGTDAIKDSTTNANHCTPSGGLASVNHIDGVLGKAIRFDGIDDYLVSKSNIGISGADDRTLTAVFRTGHAATDQRLVGTGAPTSYRESSVLLDAGATFRLALTDGNRVWSQAYADSAWHAVTILLNGSTTSDLSAFFDGSSPSISSTNVQTLNTTDTSLAIGATSFDPRAGFFNGDIAYVRVSNVARTAAWTKAEHHALLDELLTFGIDPEVTGIDQSQTVTIGIQSIQVQYKDADEITLQPGVVEIGNELYELTTAIDLTLTGLSSSTWHYVYVKPSSSGILTSANFEVVSAEPVEQDTGWYHSTNTDWRCITFIRITSGGSVQAYAVSGNDVKLVGWLPVYDDDPSSADITVTLNAPLSGGDVLLYSETHNGGSRDIHVYYYDPSDSANKYYICNTKQASKVVDCRYVRVDAGKQVAVNFTLDPTLFIAKVVGVRLPNKMYTGPTRIKARTVYVKGTQSVRVEYNNTTSIKLLPGTVHIDDGAEDEYYTVATEQTVSPAGLSASTWYYVYVKPTASKLIVTADVEISDSAPVRNADKFGWYHSTNTSWRCIGTFCTEAGGDIEAFMYNNGYFLPITGHVVHSSFSGVAGTGSYVEYTPDLPVIATLVQFVCKSVYTSSAGQLHLSIDNGAHGIYVGDVESMSRTNLMTFWHELSSSRTIYVRGGSGISYVVFTRGFSIPDDIYNGPAKMSTPPQGLLDIGYTTASGLTPTSPGVRGQWGYDSSYYYVCTDDDTWIRFSATTSW